jgi:DnaJ-class molecular chaperone
MRDPYVILGLRLNASQDEIKAAWRAAAKLVHPDQNPDDPRAAARFTEIGRAYDILKDPERRQLYDRARQAALQRRKDQTFMERREQERARAEELARARAEAAMQQEDEASGAQDGTEDMVTKIFGSRRDFADDASQFARQSAEEQAEPYREAVNGGRAYAPRPRGHEANWHGPKSDTGHQDGDSQAADAPEDDGGGFRGSSARDLIGYLLRRLTGAVPPPDKAPDLAADLFVSLEDLLERRTLSLPLPDGRQIAVEVPQGSLEGDQIRLEGQGHRLPGMKRGDVVATVRLKPHRWFRAEGHDLVTFHPVDIENAVLGCETMVETLTGQEKITIPEWSGSDQVVLLQGQGLPKPDGSRGDLLVEIRVMLWDFPDQKVIDLMRSLREGLFL